WRAAIHRPIVLFWGIERHGCGRIWPRQRGIFSKKRQKVNRRNGAHCACRRKASLMDQASMNRLRRCAALHGAGRLSKLARAPLRMGYSLACEKWLRASGGVRPVTARTFWGDRMNLFFPEEGSMALYRYRFIEEGLTSIFISQIKPGMTVFDIGAHFGYFTLLA